jgi:hypothetical protein
MTDLERLEGFDWNAGNDRKNERRGVSRAEAEQIFFNSPLIVTDDLGHSAYELRFHALGRTNVGRLLHAAFTLRADRALIRVISARDMSRKERGRYAEES